MYVRKRLSSFVSIALALLSGMHMPRLMDQDKTPNARARRGGKGKGRIGASKAYHAPRHTQRNHGKAARRRRRVMHLRRG